jgi:hypothetical protein
MRSLLPAFLAVLTLTADPLPSFDVFPGKPDPKPKPKPEPKPRHTAERERRQVKLARNVRSHNPSESAKKSDDGCGCLVLIGVIVLGIIIAFFL